MQSKKQLILFILWGGVFFLFFLPPITSILSHILLSPHYFILLYIKSLLKLLHNLLLKPEFSIIANLLFFLVFADFKVIQSIRLSTPEIKEFIITTYMAYYNNVSENNDSMPSILLLGPPGIGKSVSVKDAAKEIAKMLNKQFIDYSDDKAEMILQNPEKFFVFIDLRLTEVQSSDLIGLPVPNKELKAVQYSPLLWARVLSMTSGILFLDELTNVQDDNVLSASYKILLDKAAGFVKFHKNVLVVAAGNTPEESSVARLLPTPLINRVIVVMVKRPTIKQWIQYMDTKYKGSWLSLIGEFLKQHSKYFFEVPKEPETVNAYPTPRSWTKLSVTLYNILKYKGDIDFNSPVIRALIVGTVGERAGRALIDFLKKNFTVSVIFKDPKMFSALPPSKKAEAIDILISNMVEEYKNNNKTKYEKFIPIITYIAENEPEYFMTMITRFSQFDDTNDKQATSRFMSVILEHPVLSKHLSRIATLKRKILTGQIS